MAAKAESKEVFGHIMPKIEIGALRHLKDNAEQDGRSVLIAIFDTGIDPGAPGLQLTSDGKPKILDVLDCTGSGDVDTSTIRKADESGCIEGLHGNKLRLCPDWQNPSGAWHIGAKRAFELFPKGLESRSKMERKKRWDALQRVSVTAAAAQASAFKDASGSGTSEADKKKKAELDLRLKLLTDMEEQLTDYGPMLDCVVWNDGKVWRAALDTSEMYEAGSGAGALADFKPLTNFCLEREYRSFSPQDCCNYALNIESDGNVLSVVVDAGSHGTHVAGIAAAFHEDHPELNGVAPGAQIISCKIGDSRLGSMETGVGLTRAIIAVMQHKADLINMSYGEATSTPNAGRFIQLANEVVNKHNVIFISSAGNAGPALSTVGAPGGTSSGIISIGAYISPELAAAGHSVREQLDQGQQYTWSSRGPTPDGELGVTLSAPGGAVAPVPQWTQQRRQLMNGTSMASPNACGGVALVLSAAKARGLPHSPARVRRALENTCKPVGDGPDAALTYGRGLLQVDQAISYLEKSADLDDRDAAVYEIRTKRTDGSASGRGIYLREPLEARQPVSVTVEVKPVIHEVEAGEPSSSSEPLDSEASRSSPSQADRDAEAVQTRLSIEDKLLLESSQPWVHVPSSLILLSGGRSFEVKVDCSSLPEGLHFAEISASDSTAPWRGALFRVPVTVIKPARVGDSNSSGPSGVASVESAERDDGQHVCRLGWMEFRAGQEVRSFVAVPEGARWAELRLRAGAHEQPRGFMVRATWLQPQTRYSDTESRAYISLQAHAEHTLHFRALQASTLEITLAQFWSSLGPGRVSVNVVFHGIELQDQVLLTGSRPSTKVMLRAPFQAEKLSPSAKLTTVHIPLRPSEALLAPLLGKRDALPNQRTIHSLLLTYKLTVVEAGKHTVRLPLLNNFVYDGEFEGQMTMLFDANKRLIKVNDIYPEDVQLAKGSYTIRAQLRHDNRAWLEKLKGLVAVVERKLGDGIAVSAYPSYAAFLRSPKDVVKERSLYAGERVAMYLGPVPEDKLPKDAAPGRLLTGALALAKKGNSSGEAPGRVPLRYIVPPKADADSKEGSNSKADDEEKPKPPKERLQEAVRDSKVKMLKELKRDKEEDAEVLQSLEDDLLKEYPSHLPLLSAILASFTSLPAEKQNEHLQDIVRAADAVIAAVDETALAKHLARKTPEEGPGTKQRKKQAEEQKSALVDALEKKASALLKMHPAPPGDAEAETSQDSQAPTEDDAFVEAFKELQAWADTTEEKHALLHAKYLSRQGRHASALKALEKLTTPEEGAPSMEVLQLRAELFKKLGWHHWEKQEQDKIRTHFPPAFPLF
ncbi:hypothetical protein CVIRNUC_004710 [Coccomyxa viridis]|uniref:tripeptidyl-peptidase II n=1 Tax=Coccomyxa viridis TaxID=1274662 RepID=A0AAV1I631_9CHLO|nr:hypothetical protein CVIRNUC_004710 [Coccomyxa viridis]